MIKILASAIVMALFLGLSNSSLLRAPSAPTMLPKQPSWNCEYRLIKNRPGYDLEATCVYSSDLSTKTVLLKNLHKCAKAEKLMKDTNSCRMDDKKKNILCNAADKIDARRVARFAPKESQLVCA
jgi:hypothetical protein